ncbi:MAG TPA: hypothetical protein VGK74_01445 [Symbiobacteriaceae bacterium]|jgi:hypothetical protein
MSGELQKLNLAERAGSILRSDRQAFERANIRTTKPVLLVLIPREGDATDLADAYIPDIAGAAGLQYVRPAPCDLRNLPPNLLRRSRLVLADLSVPNENITALMNQALGLRRRVLLMAQSAEYVPRDLVSIPSVLYGLEPGLFNHLLRETLREARSVVAALP